MPDTFSVTPPGLPLNAQVKPPGSKSITNRALICAALAQGPSEINGALSSEDTLVMIDALQQLGIALHWSNDRHSLHVNAGPTPSLAPKLDLNIANSGTTIRFLTALLSTLTGEYRLDGTQRMRERPIADLLDPLRQLGADVSSLNNDGFPPVLVRGKGLKGGTAHVRGTISSQFLSGLMLAAPHAVEEVLIKLETPLVSTPYVTMTESVMASFGLNVSHPDESSYRIAADEAYRGCRYQVEPDASAASYFWAAAAIAGGSVTVLGLNENSIQGDIAFCQCLQSMGCEITYGQQDITVHGRPLQGIDVDMNAISDTVQTMAVVALFAEGPTKISNVAHIRHKESDRIADLARELRKLGATIDEHDDGLTIHPAQIAGAELETYHDHRMAMSLALAGLKIPGVVIRNPRCTEKTYPDFFVDLQRLITSKD